MAVIGTFKPSRQGGWEGSIRTLAIERKVRLVPNDDRSSEATPAFRLMMGWQRIGDAWEARFEGKNPRDYLRVRIDDPWCPITAALFESADGMSAQLVWTRPLS